MGSLTGLALVNELGASEGLDASVDVAADAPTGLAAAHDSGHPADVVGPSNPWAC